MNYVRNIDYKSEGTGKMNQRIVEDAYHPCNSLLQKSSMSCMSRCDTRPTVPFSEIQMGFTNGEITTFRPEWNKIWNFWIISKWIYGSTEITSNSHLQRSIRKIHHWATDKSEPFDEERNIVRHYTFGLSVWICTSDVFKYAYMSQLSLETTRSRSFVFEVRYSSAWFRFYVIHLPENDKILELKNL